MWCHLLLTGDRLWYLQTAAIEHVTVTWSVQSHPVMHSQFITSCNIQQGNYSYIIYHILNSERNTHIRWWSVERKSLVNSSHGINLILHYPCWCRSYGQSQVSFGYRIDWTYVEIPCYRQEESKSFSMSSIIQVSVSYISRVSCQKGPIGHA